MAKSEIDLVKITNKYVVVNKPSGIQCSGFKNYAHHLLPQLTKKFKALHPDRTLNASQFKLVHRLDKYVTGGLVVARDRKWAMKSSKSLSSKGNSPDSIIRRYVGLLPIPEDDSLKSGWITYDIQAPQKDYKGSTETRKVLSYKALTIFQILDELKLQPTKTQLSMYPKIYSGKCIVPIILQLQTGRKNQLRDHTLQSFNTTLLNDDNFEQFKYISMPRSGINIDVNSTIFKSNQIGLHSAFIEMPDKASSVSFVFPICAKQDRVL
ncbi:pseudouridylate synthase, partial [Scheffersomyces stipitis CBS 6054]